MDIRFEVSVGEKGKFGEVPVSEPLLRKLDGNLILLPSCRPVEAMETQAVYFPLALFAEAVPIAMYGNRLIALYISAQNGILPRLCGGKLSRINLDRHRYDVFG